MYGSRRPSSDVRSTPDRLNYSLSSANSDATSTASRRSRNPVVVAARSVAGAFAGCFAPPEDATSSTQASKFSYKFSAHPAASPNASPSGSERVRRHSGSER
ncbi:hypothetical protein CRG98_047040, partial [Punica granatum]